MAEQSTKCVCLVVGAVLGLGLLLTIILVPMSFSSLEYYEVYILHCSSSSLERAFAHGAMGCRIDPSWSGPIELISCTSQCSTTGVTEAVVCGILSAGWCV